jgi:eukaryotic-like serine/threonine-protein kinase
VGFGMGSWSPSGTIVFATGAYTAALYTVPAAGGEPVKLAEPDASRGEVGYYQPRFLPDGRSFHFQVGGGRPEVFGLYVATLDAPKQKRRIRDGYALVQYVRPGWLLASWSGSVTAQQFDVRRLEPVGNAVPVARAVDTHFGFIGSYAASETGAIAWLDDALQASQLEWRDRAGRSLGTFGDEARYTETALAPDGSRVAARVLTERGAELRVIDVARGTGRVVADGAALPVWSPDGRELLYTSADGQLLREPLDGSTPASPLTPRRDYLFARPESWSGDGSLVYIATAKDGQAIWARTAAGDSPARKVLERIVVLDPQLSPDGRWIAYGVFESGHPQILIRPFGRAGEPVLVYQHESMQPRWRGDGRELFFLSDSRLMSVDVRPALDTVTLGQPRLLMDPRSFNALLSASGDYTGRDYCVSADGQRFLFRTAARREPRRMHVLLNWPSLLASDARP